MADEAFVARVPEVGGAPFAPGIKGPGTDRSQRLRGTGTGIFALRVQEELRQGVADPPVAGETSEALEPLTVAADAPALTSSEAHTPVDVTVAGLAPTESEPLAVAGVAVAGVGPASSEALTVAAVAATPVGVASSEALTVAEVAVEAVPVQDAVGGTDEPLEPLEVDTEAAAPVESEAATVLAVASDAQGVASSEPLAVAEIAVDAPEVTEPAPVVVSPEVLPTGGTGRIVSGGDYGDESSIYGAPPTSERLSAITVRTVLPRLGYWTEPNRRIRVRLPRRRPTSEPLPGVRVAASGGRLASAEAVAAVRVEARVVPAAAWWSEPTPGEIREARAAIRQVRLEREDDEILMLELAGVL